MTDDDHRRFYRFAPAPGATAATVSAASTTIDSSALAAATSGDVPGLIHHTCPDLAGQSDKKWIVLPVPSENLKVRDDAQTPMLLLQYCMYSVN
jgi:hypothetical protein